MKTEQNIRQELSLSLDDERYQHSLRVQATAIELAKVHGVDPQKASLAGLLHDCARRFSREGLLAEAGKRGLPIDEYSRLEPKLLHAKLSALLAAELFGVDDPAVLSAIEKHTLGAPQMSKLDEIIYLADHCEEGRDHPRAAKNLELAKNNLAKAVAAVAADTLSYLEGKGLKVHPGTRALVERYS